jgi:hypothetical protein
MNLVASPEIVDTKGTPDQQTPEPKWEGDPKPVEEINQEVPEETLYLIGRPTLKQYLYFVRNYTVHPPEDGVLMDEWQAANDVVRALEKQEAGAADNPPITTLNIEKYEPLLTEFLKDPLVKNGFNTVPTDVALVELDRLVVYQHHIDVTYAGLLARELGNSPSDELIFRTSLLHDHPRPPVKWSRVGSNTFVFMSPSNDLRFLGSMKLQASNITDYRLPGDVAGVVGLTFGFGSNFLNAIYVENRLILNNGSHRAYALRKMGVTHVPCIIQHAASRDQLEVLARPQVVNNLDHFLKSPRPSMLRDYFDPRLHKIFPVRKVTRQVTVKFEVEDTDVPAF